MRTNDHPLIWGHRGASGHAPENTLPAFRMAADMGADGVELDVQETKDGVLVVCHDETVDRTSNGAGWVKDFTFEEIRKLDFSGGNAAYEGLKIPSMEEVLDLLAPTGLTINIELKTGIVFYDRIEEKILQLVRNKNWEVLTTIQSAGSKSWTRQLRQASSTPTAPSICPVTGSGSGRMPCILPFTTSNTRIFWKTAAGTALPSMSGPSIPRRNFCCAGIWASMQSSPITRRKPGYCMKAILSELSLPGQNTETG